MKKTIFELSIQGNLKINFEREFLSQNFGSNEKFWKGDAN